MAEAVAAVGRRAVSGDFYRHAAPERDAFAGGYHGRWGASFPVIYLARPKESTIIEAYRHLVEDAGVPPEHVKGRILYRAHVAVAEVLDITSAAALARVGLNNADLASPVGDYEPCQRVAAAAHQLKFHGILAPSAEGGGQTLALFRDRLTIAEIPDAHPVETWPHLPQDPRTADNNILRFRHHDSSSDPADSQTKRPHTASLPAPTCRPRCIHDGS